METMKKVGILYHPMKETAEPLARKLDEFLQAKGVSFARSLDDEIQTARFEAYHPVDDDLAAVSGQTSLKELYAEAPAVTDKGFAEVAKLTNLKVLSVSKSGISGTGMTAIARLKDLQQLELPGSAKLDDAAIASLKGHSISEIRRSPD